MSDPDPYCNWPLKCDCGRAQCLDQGKSEIAGQPRGTIRLPWPLVLTPTPWHRRPWVRFRIAMTTLLTLGGWLLYYLIKEALRHG